MRTPSQYFDLLKEKTGSDYRTAKELKLSSGTIAQIRSRELMSDETAIKVADNLGIDRIEVLLAAAMARSEGEVLTTWKAASKRMGIAATLALAAIMPHHDSQADSLRLSLPDPNTVYYVKLLTGILIALFRLFSTRSQNHDTQKTWTQSFKPILLHAMV